MKRRVTIRMATLMAAMMCAPALPVCAQQPWPLWQSYLKSFSDPQGRLIDRSAGERTTSEGQAYGLFFALVANDRDHFDRILAWTERNLTQGGLSKSLPAWLWGESSAATWGVLDRNSAADADLWMSYSLLQAARLWKEPRYFETAGALARLIEEREVVQLPGFGPMLFPAPHGFQEGGQCILNPSYPPPQLVQALASEFPNTIWSKVEEVLPLFLEQSASGQFAMDWVDYSHNAFHPTKGPGEVAGGSYDAIRVYLWIGMLPPHVPNRDAMLHAFSGMVGYLQKHAVPPERVSPQGQVLQPNGSVGFSAALLPYLFALSDQRAVEKQKARLAAELSPVSGLYGANPTYYDQVLVLFATGWSEGRFRFERNGQLLVPWSK
jgi:endoglucanase